MKPCPYCPARHPRPDALDVIHTCTMRDHDGIDMTTHHLHTVAGRYLAFRYDQGADSATTRKEKQ